MGGNNPSPKSHVPPVDPTHRAEVDITAGSTEHSPTLRSPMRSMGPLQVSTSCSQASPLLHSFWSKFGENDLHGYEFLSLDFRGSRRFVRPGIPYRRFVLALYANVTQSIISFWGILKTGLDPVLKVIVVNFVIISSLLQLSPH